MKMNIGLVGPGDSVELAQQVAREFDHKIRLHSYIYQQTEEVPGIVSTYHDLIDVWVFTGRLPYWLATSRYPNKKMLCIPTSGSALMKQLFRIQQDRLNPARVSIESFQGEMILEMFEELSLPVDQLHLMTVTEGAPAEQIESFHASLYLDDRVDACITSRSAVHRALQHRGIPVYRITPTKVSIRQTFELACQQAETDHFRKSQIALLVIHIQYTPNRISNYYESNLLHLKIEEMILRYAQTISGSYLPVSKEKFILFSARGVFEQNPHLLPMELLQQMKVLTHSEAYCGIGYGQTVLEAEQHAMIALQHAEQRTDSQTIVVDERGNVCDPLFHHEQFIYNYRTENPALIEKLKQAGIHVSTYSRIVSLQNSLGKKAICAADVAEWLDMTQRNANRILTHLEQAGLARVVGQEKPTTRGRPRNIYRLGSTDSYAEHD